MVKTEITTFNKANLQALRTEIDNALKAVENQFGIKLSLGKISSKHSQKKQQIGNDMQDYMEWIIYL